MRLRACVRACVRGLLVGGCCGWCGSCGGRGALVRLHRYLVALDQGHGRTRPVVAVCVLGGGVAAAVARRRCVPACAASLQARWTKPFSNDVKDSLPPGFVGRNVDVYNVVNSLCALKPPRNFVSLLGGRCGCGRV
jgi:hypothetical protein